MRDQHPLSIRVAAAMSGMLLLISASALLVQYGLGAYDGGYQLVATFDHSSNGLDDDSSVKLRGVNVGDVAKIRLRADGRADVTLHIDDGVRVPVTTSASIQPLSVFGPSFVDLDPGVGDPGGPVLGDHDRIEHTTAPIAFTDVLGRVDSLLQRIDPVDVHTIVRTFADSVAGLGPQLRRTLLNTTELVDLAHDHLPEGQQFLRDLARISGALVDQSDSFRASITNLGDFLPAVAQHTDQLDQLLGGASEVAGSLAAYIDGHQESFGAFVDSSARLLGVAADQAERFPDLFRLIDEFFGRIGDALRLDGPGGVLIGALHGGVLESVCANFNLPVPCTLAPT
jgi:phospholipid/cholesterol/gamma-HCH transport system substrate-binding protein